MNFFKKVTNRIRRFFKRTAPLFLIASLFFQNFLPLFFWVKSPVIASDEAPKIEVFFKNQTNSFLINFIGLEKADYLLAYQTKEGKVEVVTGYWKSEEGNSLAKEIYAGVCSQNVCLPHSPTRGILKVLSGNWQYSQKFLLEDFSLRVVEEETPQGLELTEAESFWLESKNISTIVPTPVGEKEEKLTLSDQVLSSFAPIETEPEPELVEKKEEGKTESEISVFSSEGIVSAGISEGIPAIPGAEVLNFVEASECRGIITTDKEDYTPSEVVVISGIDFEPNTAYILKVSSTDEPALEFTAEIKSDENGSFVYLYQLDGNYRPNYKVEVLNTEKTVLSLISFTDSQIPNNVKLYQWETVPQGNWITGNLGSNNSNYKEGETVPFLLDLGNLSSSNNPYTFSVCRDYENGTKRGYYELKPFNTSRSATPPGTVTSNFGAFSGIKAEITSVLEVGGQGLCNSGQRETKVTFNRVGNGDVYILWGGKLASPIDSGVGAGNGAASYPGSSLAMTLLSTSKSLSINPGAVIELATITVKKVVDSGGATPSEWGFSLSPNPNSETLPKYPVVDTVTFLSLPTGSYQIAETSLFGYSFVSGEGTNCVFNNGIAVATVSEGLTATNAVCVFHNAYRGYCGDGIINGSEVCDDGVHNGEYGYCDVNCTGPGLRCGDGVLTHPPEECDGELGVPEHYRCTANCVLEYVPYCGDGNIDLGEECDGNNESCQTQNGYQGIRYCSDTCHLGECLPTEFCGDGIKNGPEECDKNDGVPSGYTCSENCVLVRDKGTIVIDKITEPSQDSTNFNFNISSSDTGVNEDIVLKDQDSPFAKSYETGVYVIEEKNLPNGWDLSALVCDQPATIDLSSRKAIFDLDLNERITCVFTNTKRGSVSVHKFEDDNLNGLEDSGEDPVSGIEIRLYKNNACSGSYSWLKTDSSGNVSFDNLVPGNYAVSEFLSYTQWINITQPDCRVITLQPGENKNIVFGNYLKGNLFVWKYHDLNQNKIYDQNENYLPNWTIRVYKETASGWVLKGQTNTMPGGSDMGQASFNGIFGSNGVYYVCERKVSGWEQTDPSGEANNLSGQNDEFPVCKQVVVDHSGQEETIYLGNIQLGSISGYKWEDLNGDGIWNENEPVVNGENIFGGLTIFLDLDNDGNQDEEEARTDIAQDGSYSFSNLLPGIYSVCERDDLLTGWKATSPRCRLATVSPGQETEQVNFGNFKLGIVQGRKFNDLNADGNRDAGESYLNGWIIRLYKKNGNNWNLIKSESTGHTGTAGQYQFKDLVKGQYKICEVLQTNWGQTSPAGNPNNVASDEAPRCRITSITGSGQSKTGQNFGNIELGKIIIEKQTTPNDNETDYFDFITDYKGSFSLKNGEKDDTGFTLIPGEYVATESAKVGWDLSGLNCTENKNQNTTTDFNNRTANIVLDPGETVYCIFDNTQRGSISGTKYEDLNGDGNRGYEQGSEPGIEGWIIKLYDSQGSEIKSFDTDSKGDYWFDDLLPGDYKVCEVLQNGWINTEPGNESLCYDVNLEPGENLKGKNFGNFRLGKISGYKWEDLNANQIWDDNEKGLAGWEISLTDESENTKKTITDENGFYEFSNLLAGNYALTETLKAGWLQTKSPEKVKIISGTISSENNFGNVQNQPLCTIEKTNNKIGLDLSPGENVVFSIKVSCNNENVQNMIIKDLFSSGFKYRNGSWTAISNVRGNLRDLGITPEPIYASPGTWQLGNMVDGEEVTVTYITDISQDQSPGLYKDLAWAKGASVGGSVVLANETTGIFVGTEVNVVREEQSSESYEVEKEERKVGQVLGATTLPATGAESMWLIAAIILIFSGLATIKISKTFKKEE